MSITFYPQVKKAQKNNPDSLVYDVISDLHSCINLKEDVKWKPEKKLKLEEDSNSWPLR